MPAKETLRKEMILTGEGLITWSRKPAKLPGPALPVSTRVVQPPRASRAGSTPSDVPPQ